MCIVHGGCAWRDVSECRRVGLRDFPAPPEEPWRSDAVPTPNYRLEEEIIEGQSTGTDLVLGLNIRGDGREDVLRYVQSTGQIPQAYVFLSPPSQGAQSIGGGEDATAMAFAIREKNPGFC